MASKRAAVCLAQAATRSIPTRAARGTSTQLALALRRYHSRARQPSVLAPFVATGVRQSAPVCATSPGRARGYSTESEGNEVPNKIWDFEAVKKLTATTPKPSVTIVDVREPHELQESGKIPGAINIPITSAPDSFFISEDEFEDRFGHPRPAPDAEVVFYCRAGVRSRAASELARQAGWTNVGEYPGSWNDWVAKGGEVER
ncbi:hypothetical protein VTK26DRAFT_6519 [Humicola hyalothermophila]